MNDNVISINRPWIDKLNRALDIISKANKCCEKKYNAIFIDSKGFFRTEIVRPGTRYFEFVDMPPQFESAWLNDPDHSQAIPIKRVVFEFYELKNDIAIFKESP